MSYSHPDQPVRHSYPLAIKDDGFGVAFGLAMKTMPYILMRLGVMLAFTVAMILWFILCGGLAWLFSGKNGSGGGGVVLFLIAIAVPSGLYYWLRQYMLYLLKCGHVAVLTRLITDGSLPQGVNQVTYGKDIVLKHFVQTNVLVAVDSLVTGTVNAFNSTLDWVAGMIPIPGLDGLMKVVNTIVKQATTFIDETVLSYNLARGDENVWRSSMDGVVYYASNAKAVLKTAVVCVVIQYALTAGIFVVCLIPAWMIKFILPQAVASFAWVLAVVLAAAIKSAFLEPLFLTMVALTFHKNVHNQPINESFSDTLTKLTGKFVELKEKAATWVSGRSEQGQSPQNA